MSRLSLLLILSTLSQYIGSTYPNISPSQLITFIETLGSWGRKKDNIITMLSSESLWPMGLRLMGYTSEGEADPFKLVSKW